MTVMVELESGNETLVKLVQQYLDNVIYPEKESGYKCARRVLDKMSEDIKKCISIDTLFQYLADTSTKFDSFNELPLSEKKEIIQSYIAEKHFDEYTLVNSATFNGLFIQENTFNLLDHDAELIGVIDDILIEENELKFIVSKRRDDHLYKIGSTYTEEIYAKFIRVEDMTPNFLDFTIENCRKLDLAIENFRREVV